MRTRLAALLVSVACGGATSSSGGGVEPADSTAIKGQTTTPVEQQDTILKPATLLRRLAEAADGYRDGRDKFVVAAQVFPHKVAGVFSTREEADRVARDSARSPDRYAVFGPYRTPPDMDVSPEVNDVDSVVTYLKDKTTRTYDGDEYDALFWSLPAFDKFVAPYLTFVAGADHAQRQREAYKRGDLTNSALPHRRGSL
jgi:hypothetical protein